MIKKIPNLKISLSFALFIIIIYKYTYNNIKSANLQVTKKNNIKESFHDKIDKVDTISEQSIVLIKNQDSILPIKSSIDNQLFINVNGNGFTFEDYISYYSSGRKLSCLEFLNSENDFSNKHLIFSIHENKPLKNELKEKLKLIPKNTKITLILFCENVNILDSTIINNCHAIILASNNSKKSQKTVAQILFGAKGIDANLNNLSYNNNHVDNVGFLANGRLGFSDPEVFGIPGDSLKIIDSIANNGIIEKAYPGCQVLIAHQGEIIYNKSFGKHTYDINSKDVSNHDLYDLASITKIAASTLLTMKLHSDKQINLNNTLSYYLEECKNTPYADVTLKSMMAHQAGFTAWIPFYRKTLLEGSLNPQIYSQKNNTQFTNHVAKNIFMNKAYQDSIYSWIYETPLKNKTYKYSDLCFYFIKKILEKRMDNTLDHLVTTEFYKEMGLHSICYNPLNKFDITSITPTENDLVFRNQLVHGFVHDQGAAMLGGIGGHAGLFSNAYDLAAIMQLFLNKGSYAGTEYIKSSTIDEFTRQQFSGNRRGAGFDRPKASGGGTCDESCSQKSYGHSGFTGTLAWADPENQTIVVFLSNRVYPDAQNWKLVEMNIRTDIQQVVNRLIKNSKK